MATVASDVRKPAKPLAPDAYERVLAIGSIVLLACVVVALAKGRAEWARVPWQVWPHLGTVVLALALTPFLLLRRRGDRQHRIVGTVWVAAMLATAVLSFGLPALGKFSVIHVLSVIVIITAPLIWWAARTHRVAEHRRRVRAVVTGALLIAGFFTFPFNRLLGHWLFA